MAASPDLHHKSRCTTVLVVLQGLKDPEAKRKAIGAGFIEVFNDFAKGFDRKPRFLVQACSVLQRFLQPSDSLARSLHILLSRRVGVIQDTSQHSDILHQHEERGPLSELDFCP